MQSLITGRVWTFGDDVDTDSILPMPALFRPLAEQPGWCMRPNRPGWAELVRQGDVVVGGRNFGTGSSRPAARVMKDLGLSCLVAESLNGLFFRNCVNLAFPALEVPGVRAAFDEGDEADVDLVDARVRNRRTGVELRGIAWPGRLRAIIEAGGLLPMLAGQGYIRLVSSTDEGGRGGPTRSARRRRA